jgi:hypothetical protein
MNWLQLRSNFVNNTNKCSAFWIWALLNLLKTSVVDPDPDWIRINGVPRSGSEFASRIRIQEDKDYPENQKQLINFIF